MTPQAVIDTHAVIWYLNADSRLSAPAKTCIEDAANQRLHALVPSICLVEIIYLSENGRIPPNMLARLEAELLLPDAVLRVTDLTQAVALAVGRVPRSEVPELPDRIIARTGLHFNVPVISRDHKIRSSVVATIL
jgi:PIN domain nuclease of toxin-antitoxin system